MISYVMMIGDMDLAPVRQFRPQIIERPSPITTADIQQKVATLSR